MKNILVSSLFCLALFCAPSCSEPETQLDVNFRLTYDDQPLAMFENVEFPSGKQISFSRFSFYLSELQIGSQSIEGAQYLDLTADHSTPEKAAIGTTVSFPDLEEEDINNISFSIGLNPTVNATIPGDYTSSNDLSLSSEYWTPWSSYIFSKTEGRMDADEDGTNELNFALHLGLDDAFREVNLEKEMTLSGESTVVIKIDLKKLFENAGVVYDLEATPQIHQTNTINEINQLCDNLVTAFSID